MPKRVLLAISVLALAFASGSQSAPSESTSDLLRRRTQELLDAIGAGATDVWDKYLDENARIIDETGAVMTKKELLDQMKPLPKGVSGNIQAIQVEVVLHGDAAVVTYVDDEHENYHGHELHCQYRTTDTWRKTAGGWREIASQVLALRTDPPAMELAGSLRDEYVGRYSLTPEITYEIRRKGDALEGQQIGRKEEELRAEAPDVLFSPGKPRYRRVFQRDSNGRITGFAERREAWDLVWKRST
ncbi:MAG TPA: nuclear transport factor 2 family protein [Thermoanaerobaculia bacterium]